MHSPTSSPSAPFVPQMAEDGMTLFSNAEEAGRHLEQCVNAVVYGSIPTGPSPHVVNPVTKVRANGVFQGVGGGGCI